jgi:hypothetical protein
MAGKRKDVGSEAVLTFRLPRELHRRLVEASTGRSVSEEMRRRLEASFAPAAVGAEDPRFRDLLTAIGHAAAAAAKMPALREVSVGKGARRREDDKTPYVAFREAVASLMDAFEPEGVRMAPDETLIRLVDQLVGIALGALGDRGLAAFTNLTEVEQASMGRSGAAARAMAAKAKERSPEEGSEP